MPAHDTRVDHEVLRDHGVQVTAQRLAVMRAISEKPHRTADDVAEAVRSEIGSISRQGVYDALRVLVDHGLVRRIRPGDSPSLYERRVGDNHHHLVCRICGSTVDVDCRATGAPCLDPVDTRGYTIDEAEVVYWGTCPRCQETSHRRTGTTRRIETTKPRQP